jgi:hypothetical protein
MKCFLPVHFHRPQASVPVRRQHLARHPPPRRSRTRRHRPTRHLRVRCNVVNRPALPLNHHRKLRRCQRHRPVSRVHLEHRPRPILLHHHAIPRPLRRSRSRPALRRRIIRHVQHVRRLHLNPQHPILLHHLHPVRGLCKAHHRIRRIPLPHRHRRHRPHRQPRRHSGYHPQQSRTLHLETPSSQSVYQPESVYASAVMSTPTRIRALWAARLCFCALGWIPQIPSQWTNSHAQRPESSQATSPFSAHATMAPSPQQQCENEPLK